MKSCHTSSPTLWIVEDDQRLRELVLFAAQQSGRFAAVEVAVDGQDAWERLVTADRAALPDVILTDLSMPRLDGLQLVAQIKGASEFRDIPIAMFSSSRRPDDEADALKAGCSVFIEKPVSFGALFRMLVSVADLVLSVGV